MASISIPIAAAVVGGVASSATGALLSKKTASGQSAAIDTGQEQANAALQAGKDQANLTLKPYLDTGQNALTRYADITGVNGPDAAAAAMSGFAASPGYQYQVQQGLRAVDAGAASKGMLRSGATLKAEQTLGTNLANQDFTSYISRLNDLAGFGSRASTTAANADVGTATQIAGTDASAAGNRASIAGAEGTGLASAANLGVGALTNGLTKYFTSGPTVVNPNVDTVPTGFNDTAPSFYVSGY